MNPVSSIKFEKSPLYVVTHIFWIFVKASFNEFFERSGKISRQLRGIVFGYQKEDSHGMHLRVGGLALSQLDGSYSWKRKNILTMINKVFI